MIFRSLIFWFGLLCLGFLAWAWWDSTITVTAISRSDGMRRDAIANANSAVRLYRDASFTRIMFKPGWDIVHRDKKFPNFVLYPMPPNFDPIGSREKPYLPVPAHRRHVDDNLGRETWIIPHWLLAALFLPAWIALLVWWSRRRSRLIRQARPAP